jgi:nucleotide-binding universal stress UspA family protein/nitrite reductase/ring-hydroxylating ferredoxin subunit
MGYRRIVVGTDGSETAGLALRAASRLAKRCRADLLVVCGFEPPAATVKDAEEVLGRAREIAAEEGKPDALTAAQLGRGADVILDVARRRDADLIVVGSKGLGKARRLGLGGVPDQVAHQAPCDVLITRTTGLPEPAADADDVSDSDAGEGPPLGVYRTILIGTDGSPTANEAARKGLELALLVRAKVTLVHVGDPLIGAIVLEETAAARLGRTEVTSRPVQGGDPARRIVELAEAEGVDLIVVGNKGMAGARRLLGSVPNEVAHSAGTDVLVAKTVGRSVGDLAPGHGGVVAVGATVVAAYRDETGAIHAVSPRCTHMGCTVGWNDTDRTWDCPCHGSRFDVDGQVLSGPAERPLAPQ